ncbi:RHS repeat-associated core domain-containing protein [Roseivirga thermotolerans]|uniref:RHS repeat-associated core domain-containing protein n=1 Tax=Roseivirga thermotolerans TaxID=1758176 RepID=A0ABQ3IAH0_9BACT|nr:RHS repeat-associated core domain-containing protein [Roseivirga thermotolerans]GHE75997.1 hypothetical protein GCM10011340_36060 [Roseivirga thermotolerans]
MITKPVEQAGFIYIYLSNESNTTHDVYFDDLRITHTKSKILQEDHYYPFGGSITALSSTAPLSKPNNFKYNGNEEQIDFDLNLYDFNARFYDPVLGRFTSVDPLADHPQQYNQSTYQFGWNNPILLNDPTGECPDCIAQVIGWLYRKKSQYSNIAKPGLESANRVINNKSGELPNSIDVDSYTRDIIKVSTTIDDVNTTTESLSELTDQIVGDFGEGAVKTGDAMQKTGIGATLLGAPEVGVPLSAAGTVAETIGTGILIFQDIAKGDYKNALFRGVTLFTDRQVSSKIRQVIKQQELSSQAGAVLDANKEVVKEGVKKVKEELDNDR